MTPYFKDWQSWNIEKLDSKYKNTDDYLFDHLDKLASTKFDYNDRNFD
jgi:hypothetical protein